MNNLYREFIYLLEDLVLSYLDMKFFLKPTHHPRKNVASKPPTPNTATASKA
jgi:hypothetical protein